MLAVMDKFLHKYYSMHGSLPSIMYSDGASVNTSAQMQALLQQRAVAQRFTVPHQSEQNPAEVYIRILCAIARTNLQASNRPLRLWGEALMAANYLRNRMPCTGNPGAVSPYQMEFGHPPDNSHHRPWGQTVYSHLPHDDRENSRGESLDAAAEVGILVGYQGNVTFDASKPDGAPRKLMDSSRLEKMGWKAGIGLREGLLDAYKWFLDNQDKFRH